MSTSDPRTRNLIRYGGSFLPGLATASAGVYVQMEDGRRVLDFTSGQMSGILGHSHPAVVECIRRESESLIHLFSGMLSKPVVELAEKLSSLLPDSLSKVLLLTTGAESNEAALRLAKLYTGGFEVLAFDAAWHGMTGAVASTTLSASRKGYGPGMPGVLALPTPNRYRRPPGAGDGYELQMLDTWFQVLDRQSVGAYAAAMVEPLLSSGGMIEPPEGYLEKLKGKCQERGMLLIFDEAQTGMGRTGKMFAFEHHDVVPDILTLSKTLGAGLPLAATITSPEIEEKCHERGFLFYTTHVSDPLPAAVGCTVVDVILRERLADHAREMGSYFAGGLRELQARHECIGDVRGRGLMLGVELVADRESKRPVPEFGAAVSRRCFELGLSMNITQLPGRGGTFRMAPPLIIQKPEIEMALEILDRALRDTYAASTELR
ncbi:MAG TPA: aspartate aminotransferase family protein [Vicinamibacteria bacterium]|nr:aspartate aminotransferase family protein [Vicinamibacteria bacterium]